MEQERNNKETHMKKDYTTIQKETFRKSRAGHQINCINESHKYRKTGMDVFGQREKVSVGQLMAEINKSKEIYYMKQGEIITNTDYALYLRTDVLR